jgi:perosamine synthetase
MSSRLAIDGGTPVRAQLLPYGRQSIDESDIHAVIEALRSPWLTTGPAVGEFERAFAETCGAADAVAVASGTAALHAAMHAIGIAPGDEVIVASMTFAASANCVLYQGGRPVFADIDAMTLLIDPGHVEAQISPRTKAIIAVDYAGQPCDYDSLRAIADRHGLFLISDSCHALGATYRGRPAGSLAGLSVFSLHPVKHVTTGEGGVVTTDDSGLARRMRTFRSHGITSDHRQREATGSWFYEMVELGYNYRLTDFQCALGKSQLSKLHGWVERRQAIAREYHTFFGSSPGVTPLRTQEDVGHAYHLYVVKIDPAELGIDRDRLFAALRAEGIGSNVHYIPVHLHPYYRRQLGTEAGMCPVAEAAYENILSIPMFPAMTPSDVQDVLSAFEKIRESTSPHG